MADNSPPGAHRERAHYDTAAAVDAVAERLQFGMRVNVAYLKAQARRLLSLCDAAEERGLANHSETIAVPDTFKRPHPAESEAA